MMPAVSQNISGNWITRIKKSFNPLILKHKKILSNISEKSSLQFTNIHIAASNAAAKAMTGDTDSTRGDFLWDFSFTAEGCFMHTPSWYLSRHGACFMQTPSWYLSRHGANFMQTPSWYLSRHVAILIEALVWVKKEASKKAFREKCDTLESKCVHVLEISVNNDVKNWR